MPKAWSLDVPDACGVTIEQYPEPRTCAVNGDICHLGHPYNCRRYLNEVDVFKRTLGLNTGSES